jgi:uncharacterized protein
MLILTRLLTLALVAVVSATSLAPAQNNGDIMLLDAANDGDVDAVRRWVKSGENVDARDGTGRTALLIAARANQDEVARILIEAGADINAKDAIQDTPFLYAAAEGRNDILRHILSTGRANLRDTNRYGGVALIPASHHGHVETVRMLLDTEIDIDHVNNLGWTAILEAVILGDGGPVYQEIVGMLVRAGARPIPDRDGRTPLDHARAMGFGEIAKILEGRA